MVAEDRSIQQWGPLPGEDWRAHRMRVFADFPEKLAVLRIAESRTHEAEIWREWHVHAYQDDPEMQEIVRNARYDLDSLPEEEEEDLRFSREREAADNIRLREDFRRWLAKRYPGRTGGPIARARTTASISTLKLRKSSIASVLIQGAMSTRS